MRYHHEPTNVPLICIIAWPTFRMVVYRRSPVYRPVGQCVVRHMMVNVSDARRELVHVRASETFTIINSKHESLPTGSFYRFLSHTHILDPPEHRVSIHARTSLRRHARQVAVPHNLRIREKPVQVDQQVLQTKRLFRRARVACVAMHIQSALIAYPYRATVVRSCVSANLQQFAVLRHASILAHIKMVADVMEATALMVTPQLFHSVVVVASRGRAMQHQIFHGAYWHDLISVHDKYNNDFVKHSVSRLNPIGH